MDLEEALELALDNELSNLITDPGAEVALFRRLAKATLKAVPKAEAWRAITLRLHPDSAFNPARWAGRAEWAFLPPDLQAAWQEWPAAYTRLAARNPRLEVADLLSEISETHIFSSWPSRWEDRIEDWVLADDHLNPPFDVQKDTDIARIHARLRNLRGVIGGWLWWSETQKRVIYGDSAEWTKERTHRATLKNETAERRKKLAALLKTWKAQTPPPRAAPTKDDADDTDRSPPTYHPMQQFRIKPKADPV